MFFRVPGVPEELGALSYDTLLAYRGSLALRADRNRACPVGADGGLPSTGLHKPPTGGLSPATVNIRLTSLRRFLGHCRLCGVCPQWEQERTNYVLKRLKQERRRPYQILNEAEWPAFLAAARLPWVDVQVADARPEMPAPPPRRPRRHAR